MGVVGGGGGGLTWILVRSEAEVDGGIQERERGLLRREEVHGRLILGVIRLRHELLLPRCQDRAKQVESRSNLLLPALAEVLLKLVLAIDLGADDALSAPQEGQDVPVGRGRRRRGGGRGGLRDAAGELLPALGLTWSARRARAEARGVSTSERANAADFASAKGGTAMGDSPGLVPRPLSLV